MKATSLSPGVIVEPFKCARTGAASARSPAREARTQADCVGRGLLGRGEQPVARWGPYLRAFFSLSGWRELRQGVMTNIKTGFAIAKFKRANRGFGMAVFQQDALALYTEVCAALAAGDHTVLRQARPRRAWHACSRRGRWAAGHGVFERAPCRQGRSCRPCWTAPSPLHHASLHLPCLSAVPLRWRTPLTAESVSRTSL